MSRGLRRAALALAVLLSFAAGAVAHVRLRHPSNGNPLSWSSPGNISVVVSSLGSDDLPDGSHATAVRLAIAEWNSVTGTTARLVEDTDPVQQARTDYGSSDIHLVLWDETNASPYLPAGSGIVAVTPVFFSSSGRITDADVLFNGGDFSFTTSGQSFAFDVQGVATHELGHFLGLDHSGWASSSLYPYVGRAEVLQRSLTEDEIHGERDVHPIAGFGSVTGVVQRSADGSPVEGALVVLRSQDGRPAASVLSASDGSFVVRGLDPGTYGAYASPLDLPVSTAHIGSWYSGHVETDFEPAFSASAAVLLGGEQVDLGTLLVGPDVALNLGETSDGYPKRVVAGSTTTVILHGSGLNGGTLLVSDPDLSVSGVAWHGSWVSFSLTVPASEPCGAVDVQVIDLLGSLAVLPGAVEVTPPTPAVSSVSPSLGSAAGGTAVTISGSGFLAGARVVIGDQIYLDEPGGLSVVGPGTITLTTAPTALGTHDVVVLDASGVEGRLVDGFQVPSAPTLSSLFPAAGAFAGGTELLLAGSGFLPGATVAIDGQLQAGVTWVDATRLSVVTNGGPPGGPYTVDVTNPDGGLASLALAFSYTNQPDPALSAVAPVSGSTGGGTVVTLTGTNLPSACEVLFGVDPVTGAGGVPATSVTWVDASTLSVVTPAHASGSVAVLVRDPTSGQASLVPAAYTFRSSGGGGGCHVAPLPAPRSGREVLAGSAWMAFLLLVTLGLRRRPAGARVAA